jgi:alcohol dehydrogenase
VIPPFTLARLPRIEFGAGAIRKLPPLLASFGNRVLLVTGGKSFEATPHWSALLDELGARGIAHEHLRVTGEPSPARVDEAVARWRGTDIAAVAGIGGGSALDAAKAIAGLLVTGHPVADHLEGVGPELPYRGPPLPFVAVPTTAGTGSEATKNAVLSVHGADGYKKSFRDEQLVAHTALVDPDLLATCPPEVLAANGMDAFTQLLEAYLSPRANPMCDALAVSGLEAVSAALLPWYEGVGQGESDMASHRSRMAYGALLSGIALAQVGLGSVHGLAQPLGSFFPIPHGVVCGTLLASATRVNLAALRERLPDNPALTKYARVGRMLARREELNDTEAHAALLATLDDWTRRLDLPRLSAYRVSEDDLPRIVAASRNNSMKTNPVALTDDEVAEVVRARL